MDPSKEAEEGRMKGMKTLESLVPPLDLCKKIPEGQFADSALVWVLDDPASSYEEMVIPRECYDFCSMHPSVITAPAPTLEEILAELPKYDRDGTPLSVAACVPEDAPKNIPPDTWRVGWKVNDSIWKKSPTTAALKLWLELNKGDKRNTDRFKFRVWSTKEKSYGGRFHDSASIYEDGHLSVHYWCRGEYTTDILGDGFEEGDYIIEQCTGLRDKNGNLIYEGDVLLFDAIFEGMKFCVQWHISRLALWDIEKGGFAQLTEDVNKCAAIVGNIHEEKE